MTTNDSVGPGDVKQADATRNYLRFITPNRHLHDVFGEDWFAKRAEGFARFFGTPMFLIGQTVIVAVWIGLNSAGLTRFDAYPFILLNLAFSLQAAYAAPLILLAQTRQADRDKANAEADAQHREALAHASEQRQEAAFQQTQLIRLLLEHNNELTMATKELAQRVEMLTSEIHRNLIRKE